MNTEDGRPPKSGSPWTAEEEGEPMTSKDAADVLSGKRARDVEPHREILDEIEDTNERLAHSETEMAAIKAQQQDEDDLTFPSRASSRTVCQERSGRRGRGGPGEPVPAPPPQRSSTVSSRAPNERSEVVVGVDPSEGRRTSCATAAAASRDLRMRSPAALG